MADARLWDGEKEVSSPRVGWVDNLTKGRTVFGTGLYFQRA